MKKTTAVAVLAILLVAVVLVIAWPRDEAVVVRDDVGVPPDSERLAILFFYTDW